MENGKREAMRSVDYKIKEDVKNGFDIVVSIRLKQYKYFGSKTPTVSYVDGEAKISVEEQRETVNSPEPSNTEIYKVISGDTLWIIAKRFYGNGEKYREIANKNSITNPNMLQVGQELIIPKV